MKILILIARKKERKARHITKEQIGIDMKTASGRIKIDAGLSDVHYAEHLNAALGMLEGLKGNMYCKRTCGGSRESRKPKLMHSKV